MTLAALAYVNARIRARRSQMLRRDALIRLAASEAPSAMLDGWRDFDPSGGEADVLAFVYRRLVTEYALCLRVCPDAATVLRALLRLHEAENVKLVWRAIARGRAALDWVPLWRPLGALETVNRDRCRGLPTLRSFVDLLAPTPFGDVARLAYRAYSPDQAAAEMAIDRWATSDVARSADALAPRDDAARTLLKLVAAERDAAMARRSGRTPAIADAALRERKRVMTARIFRGSPYSLAPVIAYVLARDEEARALVSVAEARGRGLDAAGLRGVLDVVM